MSSKSDPSTSKVCSFCNSAEDNELEYGKIYEHNGIVTHYYCLLLSSNMEQKGNDDEGILGFLTEDMQKELRRGRRLVCSYCKKIGATLGCCNVKCKRIFHFPCGLKAGSLHQFFGEFRSYCVNHRPKQKINNQILKQICSVNRVLCYICYDEVNTSDFVKTLWAPCCQKDAWFHRNCIQQLALSAGYFFKCPLCNNKKDFQKAMLEYGIFVPSQDASWELVPNAFEELLYRHDQCDAPKCLCPKGRKHTSNNAKWELVLCRTCGSQGIHMACGELKWANPIWDCKECASILHNSKHNGHARLNGNAVTDNSGSNRNSDSDFNPSSKSNSDSDTDSDSDLDSDTDISVGTDFPAHSPLANNSTSTPPLNSVKLRPGPRSFKLQQQSKLNSNTDLEKDVTIGNVTTSKDINKSSSNNSNEKKEQSTSKENILQQENEKDCFQKEQSLSKNDERSQPIQKETDIIIIESDDDDVELITLKRNVPSQLVQQTIQSNSLHVPSASTSKQTTKSLLNVTKTYATPKSKNIMTIDLSKNDNISKPIVSESEPSSQNKSTISDEIRVAMPQNSTSDLISRNSNDLEEISLIDTNEPSFMNIKITNVTSLSPEVFESVCDDTKLHKTTISKTSSVSANKAMPEVIRLRNEPLGSSTKRSMHEASDVTDNYKKIKRNSDERLHESNSTATATATITAAAAAAANKVIAAHNINNTNNTSNINNTNNGSNINTINGSNINTINGSNVHTNNANSIDKQRNESASVSNSSEIDKNNKDPSKCTPEITNNIPNLLLNNQINNLPPLVPLYKADNVRYMSQIVSGNGVSIVSNVQQNKENSVEQRSTEYMTLAKDNQVFVQLPPINGIYLQQISNQNFTTINQNVVRPNETNVYAVPSSNIILPRGTDNVTMLGANQTMLVNQPIMASLTPISNNNQIPARNKEGIVSKGSVPASVPNAGNNSSNSYCDGDAGTRPVDSTSDSANRKDEDSKTNFQRNVERKQAAASQSTVASHSVFPKVTNNHNTCRQPRLIPRYMNLQDLKFQVYDSNDIQMILYDTFSVNIPMKNPKEIRNRSTDLAVLRKPKESSILARREDSCSSDYIDNVPAEGPRSDKLLHSSKIANCSINDKSTCAKYVTHGQDDAKENLDPIRSRMLSHSVILDNVNQNNVDDAVTTSDRFCENDSKMRSVSSDINLSVLNQTICNANVDNITDNITLVSNSCHQGSRNSSESVHKTSVRSVISASAEERPGARLFYNETSRITHNVDFDLNVVNMNKYAEKVSQDDITSSQYTDCDKIGNGHIDDSPTLWNGFKPLDNTNIIRSKMNNRNMAHVSSFMKFNEHSILNKQIDTCDSKKFIRCTEFQKNAVRRNDDTRAKSNEFCLKVSVDLCKIQSLIDSKPELFKNRERVESDANDQRCKRTNRLSGLDDYARQQVRYCDIARTDSNSNCLLKRRELQKSNYTCNVECMQRDIYPGTNTFLRYQKSNQGIKNFDKDALDR